MILPKKRRKKQIYFYIFGKSHLFFLHLEWFECNETPQCHWFLKRQQGRSL